MSGPYKTLRLVPDCKGCTALLRWSMELQPFQAAEKARCPACKTALYEKEYGAWVRYETGFFDRRERFCQGRRGPWWRFWNRSWVCPPVPHLHDRCWWCKATWLTETNAAREKRETT